jgi:hypothetical protein
MGPASIGGDRIGGGHDEEACAVEAGCFQRDIERLVGEVGTVGGDEDGSEHGSASPCMQHSGMIIMAAY